jgi:hypothetical protein
MTDEQQNSSARSKPCADAQEHSPQAPLSGGGAPFPVPEFDDATVAFGAPRSAYLTREQLGDFYDMNDRTPYHKAASGLFFRGGRLSDYGLQWKPGIDRTKAMRAIKALLCSFEPKHEIKEATVAYAFREWCDVLPAASSPEGREPNQ